ncbi:hypothetical protein CLERM_537 [Coxiella-like endosymbiont]|nr:hypothetical protein CLERM_537 [Coxiella-like endosymbiont]
MFTVVNFLSQLISILKKLLKLLERTDLAESYQADKIVAKS